MLYDILFDRLIGYYGIEHHQYQKKKKAKNKVLKLRKSSPG